MKITLRHSGGLAGTPVELAAIDTDRLDPGVAATVRKAVDQGGFFGLPARIPSSEIGADLGAFEITVEDGPRRHTVAFVDDGTPQTAPLDGAYSPSNWVG